MARQRLPILVLVAAALAALNLFGSDPTATVQPIVRATSPVPSQLPAAAAEGVAMATATPTVMATASTNPRPPLEPAQRDPFAPEVPKAPPQPKLPPPPPVEIQAPPAPQPPPLNLSFAGRFRNPQGQESVYVMLGDTSVELHPGMVLANGYQIDAISERAIELSYPPLNYRTRLDLPPAQKYQTR